MGDWRIVWVIAPFFVIAGFAAAAHLAPTSGDSRPPSSVQTMAPSTAIAGQQQDSPFPAAPRTLWASADERPYQDVVATAASAASPFCVPSAPPPIASAAHDAQDAIASGGTTDQLRKVIQEFAPDAPEDVIAVWLEEYRHLPLEDVAFLLQQRVSAGIVLPASLRESADGADSGETVDAIADGSSHAALHPSWKLALQQIRTALQLNLLHEFTPGYRRQMFFINAGGVMDSSEEMSGSALLISFPQSPAVTMASGRSAENSGAAAAVLLRRFEPGRYVDSGNPLHVALPPDPELMFSFRDGTLLSRRGDFQVLSDRRLGVSTPAGEISLTDSPVISPDGQVDEITAEGQVLVTMPSGERQAVGSVCIVRCQHLSAAVSRDGIFFADQGLAERTGDGEAVLLRTRTVELSNVQRSHGREELQQAERLLELVSSTPESASRGH